MHILLLVTLIALSGPTLSDAATPVVVKEVAGDLVCLCGDCNRESLATCVCSFATAQRQELAEGLDAGKPRREIIQQFVDEYGPIVLATPPAEGYNLLAWIAPAAALIFGIARVRSVLISWRRSHTAAPDRGSAPDSKTTETAGYEDQLRKELDGFDTR